MVSVTGARRVRRFRVGRPPQSSWRLDCRGRVPATGARRTTPVRHVDERAEQVRGQVDRAPRHVAIRSEASELHSESESGMDKTGWRTAMGPYILRMIGTGRFPTLAKVVRDATHPSPDIAFDKGLEYVLAASRRGFHAERWNGIYWGTSADEGRPTDGSSWPWTPAGRGVAEERHDRRKLDRWYRLLNSRRVDSSRPPQSRLPRPRGHATVEQPSSPVRGWTSFQRHPRHGHRSFEDDTDKARRFG